MHTGINGRQAGVYRNGTELCSCPRSPRPGDKPKTRRSSQSVCTRHARRANRVSRFRNSRSERFLYKVSNRSTADEIKKNIVKQGKRRAISKVLRPNKEKQAIAGWRLSLNRILCVLDVRSVHSRNRCRGTNFPSQIEFGSGESATVSGTHHDGADPHTATVVDAHSGTSSAETIVLTAPKNVSGSRTPVSQVSTEIGRASCRERV